MNEDHDDPISSDATEAPALAAQEPEPRRGGRQPGSGSEACDAIHVFSEFHRF